MMEIVFATTNKGKLKEIVDILAPIKVKAMSELGILTEVVEDGKTFEENAKIKAAEICGICNKIVLADDSGLEIDYLNKAPGVYSARYLGADTPYPVKNQRILEMLKDVEYEKRTARFVCVVAAAFPDGRIITRRGTIEGHIAYEVKGSGGFGYDPIFYMEQYNMTTAEMSSQMKNEISHRGQALRQIKEIL